MGCRSQHRRFFHPNNFKLTLRTGILNKNFIGIAVPVIDKISGKSMPVLMCWVAELADQSNKLITCINFSVQGERKGDTRVNSLSIKSCKLHFSAGR
jgi:hypothetical protein